jgi:hypothetical protein
MCTLLVGIATAFLAGSKEEWSLVRRHSSEGIFGVQLAGNKPATLVPTAEIIGRECVGNIDFVDVNCGCTEVILSLPNQQKLIPDYHRSNRFGLPIRKWFCSYVDINISYPSYS